MVLLVRLVCAIALLGATGCQPEPEPAAKGPPPIVLISMDTLRADRVGTYGYNGAVTPNLDAFAAQSTVFERAFSQASQTAPSHGSIFTSTYPSRLATNGEVSALRSDHLMLAQILSLYGYQTGAFVGGADLGPSRGLALGFDTYKAPVDFGSIYHTGPLALAWLGSIDRTRPYFLFVHGYDAHAPYVKPSPYGYIRADASYEGLGQSVGRTSARLILDGYLLPSFQAVGEQYRTFVRPRSAAGRAALEKEVYPSGPPVMATDRDLAQMRDLYDGAVSYGDAMFGLLMTALQDRGVLDEAIVVLLSDHGEQLGEHGVFWHGYGLGDEETHVMLMVRMPGGAGGGRRVHDMVELVDVLPTITELVGAVTPAGIDGRSLLPAIRGEPWHGRSFVHAQTNDLSRLVSVRSEQGRLTYSGVPPDSVYLPDVIEAARIDGPGIEASDGLPADAEEAVRAEMVAWARKLAPAPDLPVEEISPALKQSLRDHGYWVSP
jgi:arylsulfatase